MKTKEMTIEMVKGFMEQFDIPDFDSAMLALLFDFYEAAGFTTEQLETEFSGMTESQLLVAVSNL